MNRNLVIAGSGFAGVWAALAAARATALAGCADQVAITVVSPEPRLHIRPRLYEPPGADMAPDLGPLFDAVGVRHVAGEIDAIDVAAREVGVRGSDGVRRPWRYDAFVLATGSRVVAPAVPGLAEHAFDVDQFAGAVRLAAHLEALAARADSPARNTVVVAGGGFTGIETAAEMPRRLRAVLGEAAAIRVVIVEQSPVIGPDLGPRPRPVIAEALAACGVEVVTGAGVVAIDAGGVTLANGMRLDAATVVWTAGARASPLTALIPGRRDAHGRLEVDAFLRVPGVDAVHVAGDVAHAAADDAGHPALMSCQHALSLGRVAGYNAAADLAGLPPHAYRQPKYVTCLDLGAWGALYTEGWDREVVLTGASAKALKREINTRWIYPPAPDREAVFALAAPDHVIVP